MNPQNGNKSGSYHEHSGKKLVSTKRNNGDDDSGREHGKSVGKWILG